MIKLQNSFSCGYYKFTWVQQWLKMINNSLRTNKLKENPSDSGCMESGKVFRRILASCLTAFRGWLVELLVLPSWASPSRVLFDSHRFSCVPSFVGQWLEESIPPWYNVSHCDDTGLPDVVGCLSASYLQIAGCWLMTARLALAFDNSFQTAAWSSVISSDRFTPVPEIPKLLWGCQHAGSSSAV